MPYMMSSSPTGKASFLRRVLLVVVILCSILLLTSFTLSSLLSLNPTLHSHSERISQQFNEMIQKSAGGLTVDARKVVQQLHQSDMPVSFDEHRFQEQVRNTLVHLDAVLNITRDPKYASAGHVQHTYEDKYALTEFITNNMVASVLHVFEHLRITPHHIRQFLQWHASGYPVQLRLEAEQDCKANIREEVREVESDVQHVSEGLFGKTVNKVFHKIHDYYHLLNIEWRLYAYAGINAHEEKDSDKERRILIASRKASNEIVSRVKEAPAPEKHRIPPMDLSITWLLSQLHAADATNMETFQPEFHIEREKQTCRTPRRNDDIHTALNFVHSLYNWHNDLLRYFSSLYNWNGQRHKYSNQPQPSIQQEQKQVVQSVVPILAEPKSKDDQSSPSPSSPSSPCPSDAPNDSATNCQPNALPSAAVLLAEHRRTLNENVDGIRKQFEDSSASDGDNQPLFSQTEAAIFTAIQDMEKILSSWFQGVQYMEELLYRQLKDAIGHDINVNDFNNYMRSHLPRLLLSPYNAKPFVYAIRRENHPPEGTISIDTRDIDGNTELTESSSSVAGNPDKSSTDTAILTSTRIVHTDQPLTFRLNEATMIDIHAPRQLHTYVTHQFSHTEHSSSLLYLNSRTRPFSSFIVLLGAMNGKDGMTVKHAFILQNKAEMSIPLDIYSLPSARAFEDSISSLSPTQQRFARALREQQLSDAVFTMVVIQIKPLMERLLNLPVDALTKEIQLTQDLMELFIKYQIPSDQLSYQEEEEEEKEQSSETKIAGAAGKQVKKTVSAQDKISAVKGYVRNVYAVLNAEKQRALEESRKQAEYYKNLQSASQVQLDEDGAAPSTGILRDRQYLSAIGSSSLKSIPQYAPTAAGSSYKYKGNDGVVGGIGSSAGVQPDDQQPAPSPETSPPLMYHVTSATTHIRKPSYRPQGSDIIEINDEFDVTRLPVLLDAHLLTHDLSASIRPSRISIGYQWLMRSTSTAGLQFKLTQQESEQGATEKESRDVGSYEQRHMRLAAFDLLDALSRSGDLPLLSDSTQIHQFLTHTHYFKQGLIDTVVRQNYNPIEKFDASYLLINSFVHDTDIQTLAHPTLLQQLVSYDDTTAALLKEQEEKKKIAELSNEKPAADVAEPAVQVADQSVKVEEHKHKHKL